MKSVLPNPDVSTEGARGADADHAHFCAEMGEGLHALAQPLAILQSALEMARIENQDNPGSQRYLELAATHLRQTCETFARLQNLLAAEIADALPARMDLLDLLNPLIEVHQEKCKGSGIHLLGPAKAGRQAVLCDGMRTEQAISEAIDAIIATCEPGDTIEISIEAKGDLVELSLRQATPRGERLSARNRLGLALARANVRSQGGQFREVDIPFCVAIALPASA